MKTESRKLKPTRTIFVSAAVIVAAILCVVATSPVSHGEGSVQGYAADSKIDNGTIVQLQSGKKDSVKVATQANLQNMFGVTVDRSQLLISSSSDTVQNQVYVAVSGTYMTLVSTQGGTISSGDYVTLSSLNGVAMKAGTEEKTVFGRATASFDGKGVTLGSATLKDSTGATKTVKLGSVPVTINIQRNPTIKSTKVDLPEVLQRAGQAVAEKEVSPIRIYLSMGITLISIIAAIAILYAGVRNSMVAIGRNPMSKKSVFRALLEVILTSIVILIVGLFAVYLLLKL